MPKKVDTAGMWNVERNPLTKEGVFPYSGKVIDPTGKEFGLEPDKFYNVYRPRSEISSETFVKSLEGKPIIEGHVMLGDKEGMTPADNVNTAGSVTNIFEKDGVVYGDITIWSSNLQDQIKSGKKELSLGYIAKYRKEDGEFEGQHYDFVQYGHEANHVALVSRGRMGSDVRVYDSFTTDSLEIQTMPKDEKKDVREEIAELLKGASDEVCAKCKDAIEQVVNGKPDETKDGDDHNDTTQKKDETKDGDEGNKDTNAEPPKTQAGDEGEKKDTTGKDCGDKKGCGDEKPTGDAAPSMKDIMAAITKRDSMYAKVSEIPEVGTFDHAEMLEADVAKYACDKLGFKSVTDSVEFINGFLASRKTEKKQSRFVSDGSEEEDDDGSFESAYLNPETK